MSTKQQNQSCRPISDNFSFLFKKNLKISCFFFSFEMNAQLIYMCLNRRWENHQNLHELLLSPSHHICRWQINFFFSSSLSAHLGSKCKHKCLFRNEKKNLFFIWRFNEVFMEIDIEILEHYAALPLHFGCVLVRACDSYCTLPLNFDYYSSQSIF
jgi:hypothetical protein